MPIWIVTLSLIVCAECVSSKCWQFQPAFERMAFRYSRTLSHSFAISIFHIHIVFVNVVVEMTKTTEAVTVAATAVAAFY